MWPSTVASGSVYSALIGRHELPHTCWTASGLSQRRAPISARTKVVICMCQRRAGLDSRVVLGRPEGLALPETIEHFELGYLHKMHSLVDMTRQPSGSSHSLVARMGQLGSNGAASKLRCSCQVVVCPLVGCGRLVEQCLPLRRRQQHQRICTRTAAHTHTRTFN